MKNKIIDMNTAPLSKEIIQQIDINKENIEFKKDKSLEIYLKIYNRDIAHWLRILVYANTTYIKIAYTLCKTKQGCKNVKVFYVSCDHDSAWRSQLLERILRYENIDYRNHTNTLLGYIEGVSIISADFEYSMENRLLFII